jgi:hypothetical protein
VTYFVENAWSTVIWWRSRRNPQKQAIQKAYENDHSPGELWGDDTFYPPGWSVWERHPGDDPDTNPLEVNLDSHRAQRMDESRSLPEAEEE